VSDSSDPPLPTLGREGLPKSLLGLCQRLTEAGHRAWLVGGCVRDSLLAQLAGRSPPGEWITKDWDLATDATPEQVQRLFRRVIPTGIEHGTVTVLLPEFPVEVTTLRSERGYADGRRPDQIAFVDSIEDDLARRDFTVNAIAFEPLTAQIVDPFGGVTDLGRRLLRAVGDASRRFSEDGLRVLRAARFVATLEFELEPETARAITPSLGTYRKVSAERIRDEWNKLLAARAPSRGFDVMRRHGLLEITAPPLRALADHPMGDRLALAFVRVDAAPRGIEIRLAALLQDVDDDAARAADVADALLSSLRYSNAERKQVTRLVRHSALPLAEQLSDAELRRWLRHVGPDLLAQLGALARADLEARKTSSREQSTRAALERSGEALTTLLERARAELALQPPLSLSELAIDGKRLIAEAGYRPGRELGVVLESLLEKVIEDPAMNTPEQLLTLARTLRS
jgi:tRNA nucleotidyltransferase (CCA-adding enzyme)